MTAPAIDDPNYDPLASFESVPSISFDPSRGGHAMGEWVQLEVRDYIKLVQQKDGDGNLEWWDNGPEKPRTPKMKAVFAVIEDGEDKNLWAPVNRKEGALFRALVDAQKELQRSTGDPARRIGPGDKLAVRWARDNTAVPKKLGNHPKFYEASVQPGQPPAPKNDPLAASSDPWASATPRHSDEPPFFHTVGPRFDGTQDEIFV